MPFSIALINQLRFFVGVPMLWTALLWTASAQAAFIVNSNNDVNDGACAAHCSLREAINAANANPGLDTIGFSIPGAGPHTIQPPACLPFISDPVVIDGYSQPGASPNSSDIDQPINAVLQIEIDGSLAGTCQGGIDLRFSASGSTIRGLVINRFERSGIITFGGAFFTSTAHVIEGNFIGTDVTGTVALGNASGDPSIISPAAGILVLIGGNNRIGGTTPAARNLISGNSVGGQGALGGGILFSGASDNIVQGNFIGTDVTGMVALGNLGDGVFIGSFGTLPAEDVTGNIVGGTTIEARNVISGNGGRGVYSHTNTGTLIQGNYIGTDRTGITAIGNHTGVRLEGGANDIVGGTTAEARNIISGNGTGVLIRIGLTISTGNVVQGNFIGTDVTGLAVVSNGIGVQIAHATDNSIGGPELGAGNLISGNGRGVLIQTGSPRNLVQGNLIGTDITGSQALGNGSDGVAISDASNNTIGGTDSGVANTIAFNGRHGVLVQSGIENRILSNAIFSNGTAVGFSGLGIDLSGNGVTLNDLGDGDIGGNNLQNFPELSFAGSTTGTTEVHGILKSTPITDYTLQFFSSSACDLSGHGEGETFLGSADVTTDLVGDVSFLAVLPSPAPVGDVITMTATDPNGNTSEFSDCSIPEAVVVALDSDGDGVNDEDDFCPETMIAEGVPTISIGTNRWALVDNDLIFDTSDPNGNGPGRAYSTTDTAGCSCKQIIDAQGLGEGHTKHGCSISAIDDWIDLVN